MPVLRLGNDAPIQVTPHEDGTSTREPLPAPAVTTVGLPDEQDADGNLFPLWDINEAFTTITHHTRGVWVSHSNAPAPAWVDCPGWPELAQRIGGYYGAPLGEPPGDEPAGDPSAEQEETP